MNRGIELSLAAAIILFLGGFAASPGAQPSQRSLHWGTLSDAAIADVRLAAARDKLLATARETAATPIIRRVYRAEEIGQSRSSLGERTVMLDGSPRQSMFALAKSDNVAAKDVCSELPLLAVAYRWSGEETFKARVIAQLEEMADWSPLQRPGWSLKRASAEPVPPGFHDGCWLATGWCIRAMADAMEIMPAGSLPQPLIEKIRALLAREIASIVEDWRTKPSWFIRGNNPRTNQWIVPTEGLIRACLVLGMEKHPAEYAVGVQNLMAALDAQGPQGECHEGVMYAALTVESLLHAARAMAAAGDSRAAEHPFLHRFPTGLAHHAQPGRNWINSFDVRLHNDGRCRQLLSLLLLLHDDPVARWTLDTQFGGPEDDIAGIAVRCTHGESQAPALFASYENACRVNWRSSWDDDASGVWVRGGHSLDRHDHFDRGHVNFIFRGRPLLIEAGVPRDYGDPQMGPLYQSLTGHNVLEVQGGTTKKMPAPIQVVRLDATGGELLVDPTPGYADAKQWQRTVAWNAEQLDVTDEVRFPPEQPRKSLFRWHLGTAEEVKPETHGRQITVSWSGATMTLDSSVPALVTTTVLPDNTIHLSETTGEIHQHRCVIVETEHAVETWTLKTRVEGKK